MKKVRRSLALFLIFFNLLQPLQAENPPTYSLSSGFTPFPGNSWPLSFPPPAPPLPDTLQARLKKYGSLSVCDGISIFTFSYNGAFHQVPCGLSGEMVRGRWSLDPEGRFVIIGTWAWMNGASQTFPNSRRMIISIEPEGKVAPWNIRGKTILVYETKFEILETVKLPVPVPLFRFPK